MGMKGEEMVDTSNYEYAGMDTIFNNAITSISIGVEDFQKNNSARNLSAIRNIYSGILLLYKEKLRRLSTIGSDEVLIKSKITAKLDNEGKLIFVGEGKKTVDVNEIRNRFKSLGISTDWKRLEQVQKIRNNLEHYKLDGEIDILIEVINKCFLIIRNFLTDELNTDPLSVFDNDIWEVFLKNEEVLQKEENIVMDSHKQSLLAPKIKHYFDSIDCMHCGSELVEISKESDIYEVNGYCRTCGKDNYGPTLLERAIEISTGFEDYRSVKHGGGTLFDFCPECDNRTFCNNEEICYVCGYEVEYKSCWRCGNSLTLDEQTLEGLCFYCSHMLEKIINEN